MGEGTAIRGPRAGEGARRQGWRGGLASPRVTVRGDRGQEGRRAGRGNCPCQGLWVGLCPAGRAGSRRAPGLEEPAGGHCGRWLLLCGGQPGRSEVCALQMGLNIISEAGRLLHEAVGEGQRVVSEGQRVVS